VHEVGERFDVEMTAGFEMPFALPPDRADANKIQGCDYHPGFQQIAFVDID